MTHTPLTEHSECIPRAGRLRQSVERQPSTQKETVLAYLKRHGSITQREAGYELDVWRVSERIRELEQDGHRITHTPEKRHGKRWVRYALEPEQRALFA